LLWGIFFLDLKRLQIYAMTKPSVFPVCDWFILNILKDCTFSSVTTNKYCPQGVWFSGYYHQHILILYIFCPVPGADPSFVFALIVLNSTSIWQGHEVRSVCLPVSLFKTQFTSIVRLLNLPCCCSCTHCYFSILRGCLSWAVLLKVSYCLHVLYQKWIGS